MDSAAAAKHGGDVDNRFYKAVAERVAQVRADAGLTQAEASKRANLNRSLLARIETGSENLSLQTLSRLALAYDVRPEVFFSGLDADPASLVEIDRLNRRGTRKPPLSAD